MKTRLFIIFMLLFSSSCLHSKPEATENKNQNINLTKDNTDFACRLYANLKTPGENLFFSPFSISSALTMTYIGSENNTANEMKSVMQLSMEKNELNDSYRNLMNDLNSLQKNGGIRLLNSNALWPHKEYSFKKKYIKAIEKFYHADVKPTDFSAPQNATEIINKWVEDHTENMITELIGPGIITPTTRMILTNAVYFKGDWQFPFEKTATKDAVFNIDRGKSKTVPMMNRTETFRYTENDRLQALELPYGDGKLSMLILLPKEMNDFLTLENSINYKNINMAISKLHEKKVRVSIPKFKISSGLNLSETLIKMGMKDAFTMDADFSGMDGTKTLYLTAVLHKAYVDVNEEGTEAAAASAAVVGVKSSGGVPPYFNANHPFLFFIKENTNQNILFMGRIVDPTIK